MSLGGVTHPILADFHPKAAVAQAYGVYNEMNGNPRRSVFIIDKEGIVRFTKLYTGGVPDIDEILGEIDKINAKK